ncbi:dehydrogenase [Cohnella xylanilytica]|uniref:Gfo/Idh/MocA family oxidoreductase n=1 Tax=Cohnella xylanilytica TaxID=557555 RepID=A0A841U5W2_9BACL|nr:Gfo/Idh/MocA family oxidoreductase [Cohnella xylanilytica]MBB6693400.1 Gfo/Idh/MocA family oxidoreductase [Cohnella xylanilytica]GIO15926.1 dehydrogenase [Cohnella xylanilytica]
MERLRVGIIGLGSWGECHLEAYRALPFVEVAAVCDPRPERRRLAEEKYGVPSVYESAEELLKREDIGLVSVVTYEKEHLPPVLAALRAGKHVLVEKPVATDAAEAREMLETARKAGRFVAPGHLLRFDPKHAEARRLIGNGELGRVASIYMKRSRKNSLYRTYKRTHTVYELTIHDIDLAIWYAGSRVSEVTAAGCFLSGDDSPEVLWAQLRFENGTLAVLHSNWMTHDAAGLTINDYTEVIGELATVQFDAAASGVQLLGTAGRETTDLSVHHNQGGRVVGALKEQLAYLCECAQLGREPSVASFEDAVHGIEVADAIAESARLGRPVRIGG